jgi:hypothetical protein
MKVAPSPIPGQISLFEQVCPLCHRPARLIVYGRKGRVREACERCLRDHERKGPTRR